jgi:hypothetical protein
MRQSPHVIDMKNNLRLKTPTQNRSSRRKGLSCSTSRWQLGQRPTIPQPSPTGWVATAIKFMRPNGARYVPMAMIYLGRSLTGADHRPKNTRKPGETNQNKPEQSRLPNDRRRRSANAAGTRGLISHLDDLQKSNPSPPESSLIKGNQAFHVKKLMTQSPYPRVYVACPPRWPCRSHLRLIKA